MILIYILSFTISLAGCIFYFNTGSRLANNLVTQGEQELNKQNYNQAVLDFEKDIKTDRKTTKAYVGLSNAYIFLGDMQKAEQVLDSGLKSVDNQGLIYITLSNLYENDGNYEKEIQILKDGILLLKLDSLQKQLDKVYLKINICGNTPENLANLGLLVGQGEWIYYIDIDVSQINYSKADDNSALFKIKTDGTGKKILKKSFNATSLNVVGNWIYYLKYAISQNYYLYKIQTDGSLDTKLLDDYVSNIVVVGDFIYYTADNGNIYKMYTDGTRITKLNNVVSSYINIFGDWIYYFSSEMDSNYKWHNTYNRMRTDGTDNQEIISTKTIGKEIQMCGQLSCITVIGEWIYYI